jgi:HD-like signal output (HDOD) protein
MPVDATEERARHSEVEPPDSPVASAPLTPGLTLREHLCETVGARSTALVSRFPGDPEDWDHRALLGVMTEPANAVIRQPPVAAQRLLTANRQRSLSLDELAKTIETDPALSQALLKHANSAFYATGAGSQPIVSFKAAIQRIGEKGLEIVVMSNFIEGGLCRPGEGFDEMAALVWSHMVRVAPLARSLAHVFKVNADEVFSLALLHDVGKLVFFNRVADLRRKLRRSVRVPDGFIPEALRVLHEPLGGLAVLEWGLGEHAAQAIAHHHRNPIPESPVAETEAIYLAERIDLMREHGREVELERLWKAGQLSGSPDDAVSCLPVDEAE